MLRRLNAVRSDLLFARRGRRRRRGPARSPRSGCSTQAGAALIVVDPRRATRSNVGVGRADRAPPRNSSPRSAGPRCLRRSTMPRRRCIRREARRRGLLDDRSTADALHFMTPAIVGAADPSRSRPRRGPGWRASCAADRGGGAPAYGALAAFLRPLARPRAKTLDGPERAPLLNACSAGRVRLRSGRATRRCEALSPPPRAARGADLATVAAGAHTRRDALETEEHPFAGSFRHARSWTRRCRP